MAAKVVNADHERDEDFLNKAEEEERQDQDDRDRHKPLKSCMKPPCSNGARLREPLLLDRDDDEDNNNNNNDEDTEDENAIAVNSMRCRRVKWVDVHGLAKDIAEVREYEASDIDEDEGCVQAGQCRCVIQ